MVQAVAAEPSVAAVAASWPDIGRPVRVTAFASDGRRAGGQSTVAYRFVSPEYFSVLGHRRAARPRLYAGGTHRGRGRRGRVRNRRAAAVAPKRCRGPGAAPRARSEFGNAACGRTVSAVAHVYGRRRRPRRGRFPDSGFSRGAASTCPTSSAHGEDISHRARSGRSGTGASRAARSA